MHAVPEQALTSPTTSNGALTPGAFSGALTSAWSWYCGGVVLLTFRSPNVATPDDDGGCERVPVSPAPAGPVPLLIETVTRAPLPGTFPQSSATLTVTGDLAAGSL